MTTDPGAVHGDGLQDAWRVHDAQVQWTSQVDSKASFVLAIETAVAAGVVALASDGRRLSGLHDFWPITLFVVGVGLLVGALLAVAMVVRPRLRNPHLAEEAEENFIFFGHAKLWEPKALEQRLREGDLLPQLSRQIVTMSKIAWRKHRYLQVSITLAILGSAFVGLAAAVN